MTDRFAQLHETVTDPVDKGALAIARNGRIKAMEAYRDKPGKASRDDLDACQEHYAATVARLWRQYHPAEAKDDGGAWFRDKAAAFTWYAEQGGGRQKSSFYATVPADGKKVSRLAVSELLRKERATAPAAVDLTARREEADTRKAEADAEKAQMQAEEMRRTQDAKWVLRERADEEICVWVSRLRDAVAYHLGRAQLAVIHACGGQPARLAEVQALIDEALAAASNEIANAEEITVEIEDVEDPACN